MGDHSHKALFLRILTVASIRQKLAIGRSQWKQVRNRVLKTWPVILKLFNVCSIIGALIGFFFNCNTFRIRVGEWFIPSVPVTPLFPSDCCYLSGAPCQMPARCPTRHLSTPTRHLSDKYHIYTRHIHMLETDERKVEIMSLSRMHWAYTSNFQLSM